VQLTSPTDNPYEYQALVDVIAALPATWRSVIHSVGRGATECRVELKAPCTLEAARGIGEALAQAFEGCDVVINGLSLCDVTDRAFGYPWTTTQEMIDHVAKLIGRPSGAR
jgi:hypothetical protein